MTPKRPLFILACLLFLAGTACTHDLGTSGADEHNRWIDTPQGRLKARVYGDGNQAESPVLVVVLHGDGVKGPRLGYHYAAAQGIAEGFDTVEVPNDRLQEFLKAIRHVQFNGVVAAGLLRPGYTDMDGDRSDGRLGQRTGDNHTREVTEAVVAAVDMLKKEHNAGAVILMGHSGGGTISANILALYPDNADAALLVGCGCDMAAARARYYERTGYSAWKAPTTSLDPMTTAHAMPADKKVRLVVGENDEITAPADISRYADVLKTNGVDVDVVVAPDHGHNSVFFAPVTFNILSELISVF